MLICILLNEGNFTFSIANAVLPSTLHPLKRTIPSSCKVQKSNYVWLHTYWCYLFFIYFTSYVIVHNFCNLFLSLLHKPSSSPFIMLYRRYHWCIYAHCSYVFLQTERISQFLKNVDFVIRLCPFQGIFGATGLNHLVVCKCAPMPYSNIWYLELSPF